MPVQKRSELISAPMPCNPMPGMEGIALTAYAAPSISMVAMKNRKIGLVSFHRDVQRIDSGDVDVHRDQAIITLTRKPSTCLSMITGVTPRCASRILEESRIEPKPAVLVTGSMTK